MSMHILGPQYTTLNYRKRKTKMTKRRQEELTQEWHSHNRYLRQHGESRITFEEYLDEISNKKLAKPEFKPLRNEAPPRRGSTDHIPSRGDGIGIAAKPERKEYTGTLVKGIATMHKSNAVPVIDEEQMKDISNMRRN